MGAASSTTLRFLLLGQNQLSGPVKDAGGDVEKTGSKMKNFGRAAAVGLAAAGAAAVAFSKTSADKFKSVTTESRQLQRAMGGTIEEASKYRYAANMSGVETGTFLKSMQLLDKKLIAAKGSTSAQADMTAKLGVNFLDAAGKVRPMNELLPQIADRFMNMQDGPEKSALAMQLFGKAGSQMIPFLDKGSAGIAELTAKAKSMGLVIGKDDVEALGKSKAAQREWDAAMDGVKVQLGGAVLPLMTTFTGVLNTAVVPLVKQLAGFIEDNADSFGSMAGAVGQLLPLAGQLATLALDILVPALTATADFLEDNWSWMKYLAIAAGVLWTAMRGYTILVTLGSALAALPAKAAAAKGAMLATGDAFVAGGRKAGGFFATYGKGLGILGGSVAVIGLAGKALGDLIDEGSSMEFFDGLSGSLGKLQSALVNTKGSSTDAAREWAQAAVQSSGLAEKAAASGISIDELTKAIMGGKDGAGQLAQKWRELGDPSDETLVKLGGLANGYENTAAATKRNAEATKAATGAAQSNATATTEQKDALGRTTTEVKNQDAAVKALSDSMKLLSGDKISARQAELNFKDGLDQATAQVKENGRSLSINTAAGRSNQKWLLDQLTSLQQVATAQMEAGMSTGEATSKMRTNEAALRRAAVAAGMNKDQVDALIKKFGQLPKAVSTQVSTPGASGASATVEALRRQLANLPRSVGVSVNAVGQIGVKGGGRYAQGTGFAAGGRTLVGEFGPELVDLPAGSKVNTADTTMSRARMAGGGGQPVLVQVTVQGALATQRDIEDAVVDAFEVAVNRGRTVSHPTSAFRAR